MLLSGLGQTVITITSIGYLCRAFCFGHISGERIIYVPQENRVQYNATEGAVTLPGTVLELCCQKLTFDFKNTNFFLVIFQDIHNLISIQMIPEMSLVV